MKTEAEASRAEAGRGALAAVGCYLLWGFCPLFWALLDNVGSIEIIGQRIVWSLVLTVVACKSISSGFYETPAPGDSLFPRGFSSC